MSWLTQFVRGVGLGPVLDAIEGAEARPSPTAVATAVGSVVGAVPSAANIAISDLGSMVQGVVTETANKLLPGSGQVAAAVAGPLLAEIEASAEKWLSGATAGVV